MKFYNRENELKLLNEKLSKNGFELYNDLEKKIKLLKPQKIEKIYLFSKSGFEKNLIAKKKELNLELIDLNEVVTFLSK